MVKMTMDFKLWLQEEVLIAVALSLFACWAVWQLLALRKHPYFQTSTIPCIRDQRIYRYFRTVKALYKQSTDECPLLCLALQILCALCHVFSEAGCNIFQVYICFKPLVCFFKAETVEKILGSTQHIEKSREYHFLKPWLGTGLLTSGGRKWHSRRKLLSPCFHFNILDQFMFIFNEQSVILADRLQREATRRHVDIVPIITACTLDIICETAMGVRMNTQVGGCKQYFKALHEMGENFFYRILRPWLYADLIFYLTPTGRRFKDNLERVQGFTNKVIREKKAAMLDSPTFEEEVPSSPSHPRKKGRVFLELLLEHHIRDPTFTEEDVREEVDTFLFEGHDTTAMAINWSLYLLGLHPEIQKTAHEELNDIFQGDVQKDVTREDLAKMKYLECIIKETLRLFPSVPFNSREVNEDFEVLGHRVFKGSICFIFPYMVHRDPEHFPEPDKFIPERFFPESSLHRHPFAYIPFSAGPRNCIGQKFAMMEIKTVLTNIIRRFHITSLDPRDKINVAANLVIRNVQPLRLKFTSRQSMAG